MSFVAFLPLLISLAIGAIPVWLLRNRSGASSKTFVSGRSASPAIIRNASIAHVLRLAFFGPFLVFGAQGDIWPVLVAAASLSAGILLLFVLRQPIFEFLGGSLPEGKSVTVHAFIARLYGDDRRIRLAAAGLTLFALTTLIAGEAFALSGFLTLVTGNDIVARAVTLGAVVLAAVYAFPAGQSGTTHAGQWQLAMTFVGLFGAAALLVYLHVSALTPLSPQGLFAILFFFTFSVVLLVYRHSRYLDTGLVTDESRAAKWLSLFGKILNPMISVFVVFLAVLAVMECVAGGFSAALRGSFAALQADTRLPVIALCALVLLPLFQPLTDVANWQRLAGMESGRKSLRGDGARWNAALRGFFRIYALESGLLWLFIGCLGAISMAAIEARSSADVLPALLRMLTSGDNEIGAAAFAFLLVAIFAIALAAMSAAFSAALCTIGQDIQPRKEKSDDDRRTEPRLFLLAVIVALGLADATLRMDFGSSTFLALVLALGAPPLAFAPLALGPIVSGRGLSQNWALGVLGAGTASVIVAIAGFALSGNPTWLWAAAPACLVAASLAFAVAALSQGKRMR